MANAYSSTSNEPFPDIAIAVNGGPMSAVYPFSAQTTLKALCDAVPPLRRALSLMQGTQAAAAPAPLLGGGPAVLRGGAGQGRGPAPQTQLAHKSLGATWQFRLLHAAGLLLTLPLVAASRLSPRRWHERKEESVFVEANRAVLTALGFAFMA